jgi:hypothetical protein
LELQVANLAKKAERTNLMSDISAEEVQEQAERREAGNSCHCGYYSDVCRCEKDVSPELSAAVDRLAALADRQSKTRAELVKSGAIPDPYFNNREKVIAYNQHREDDASGRRAHLIAQLAREMDRPAPVRFPSEARSERVYQPRVLGGKL